MSQLLVRPDKWVKCPTYRRKKDERMVRAGSSKVLSRVHICWSFFDVLVCWISTLVSSSLTLLAIVVCYSAVLSVEGLKDMLI